MGHRGNTWRLPLPIIYYMLRFSGPDCFLPQTTQRCPETCNYLSAMHCPDMHVRINTSSAHANEHTHMHVGACGTHTHTHTHTHTRVRALTRMHTLCAHSCMGAAAFVTVLLLFRQSNRFVRVHEKVRDSSYGLTNVSPISSPSSVLQWHLLDAEKAPLMIMGKMPSNYGPSDFLLFGNE